MTPAEHLARAEMWLDQGRQVHDGLISDAGAARIMRADSANACYIGIAGYAALADAHIRAGALALALEREGRK